MWQDTDRSHTKKNHIRTLLHHPMIKPLRWGFTSEGTCLLSFPWRSAPPHCERSWDFSGITPGRDPLLPNQLGPGGSSCSPRLKWGGSTSATNPEPAFWINNQKSCHIPRYTLVQLRSLLHKDKMVAPYWEDHLLLADTKLCPLRQPSAPKNVPLGDKGSPVRPVCTCQLAGPVFSPYKCPWSHHDYHPKWGCENCQCLLLKLSTIYMLFFCNVIIHSARFNGHP